MMTGAAQGIDLDQRVNELTLGPLPRRDVNMLTSRVFPALRTLIKAGYFSLTVEGTEHVPRNGPAIYVGNHAGWFTLDTLLGALVLADHVGPDRLPWGAVQDELLKTPKVGQFFEAMGGFPASWLRTPEAIPAEMQIFCIYPEGTEGNCKSFVHAYQMRPWRSSFLRVAVARGAPIVPVSIVGGEECLPVMSTIRFAKGLLGTILPLPLAIVPLPSRWKFIFHEPVTVTAADLGGKQDDHVTRRQRAQAIASAIRERVQRTLDEETSNHMLVRFSRLIQHLSSVTQPRGADSAGAGNEERGGKWQQV